MSQQGSHQKIYLTTLNVRNILRLGIVLFLLFPFLFLVTQFRIQSGPDLDEFIWAFNNSFLQAILSATGSVVFGIWAGLGLVCFSNRYKGYWRTLLEILCLLPNFLPPIFTILIALNIFDPFPMGIWGIALVHTLMNFGLVAVLLARIVENKAGFVIELAYVEGASRFDFLRMGLLPMIIKDILFVGLFVFIICFQSFSVPLILGGGRGTTLEVLVYEKMRLSSDWSGAVLLSLIQTFFISAISLVIRQQPSRQGYNDRNLGLIHSWSGVIFILFFSAIYFLGYAEGLTAGLKMASTFFEMKSAIFFSFLGTMAVGLGTGFLSFLALLIIAYCWPNQWFEKFLRAYVSPSTSLACFAFLIFGPNEGLYTFVKLAVVLTLLFLNNLFRMGWMSELDSLQSQITIAYSLGASPAQIFIDVIFPQISTRAGFLAGLASVWACGDFAASRILSHQDSTLALMTESMMSSYRLNQATILSLLIIVCGFICFAVCIGGSRVLRRKFASRF